MVLLKWFVILVIVETPLKSTFHYGSIKIKNSSSSKVKLILSTFHYGSIKIWIKLEEESFYITIYIPLWFY